MNDPRLLPPPKNHLDRIRALALDLAYGFVNGEFPPRFQSASRNARQTLEGAGDINRNNNFKIYLDEKWKTHYPNAQDLELVGYAQLVEHAQTGFPVYTLTQKALALLEQPAKPPTIFISYKRDESAAFGLLIVARLKMVGIPNPFIDMDIRPGDEWHGHLQKTVQNSEYLISLLAPRTLESEIVRQEIRWAKEASVQIIPVWHNGFKGYDNLPPELSGKNAIRVKEESAEEYNNAIIRLLNRLGYAP
ncbi:MAG: toll/interleukin-1 receptor domain-containing protein [Anaerolineae bacterium]|nr:toll/interleukin-1 receptor domain-containing protein [Anaerolineae bacterium]